MKKAQSSKKKILKPSFTLGEIFDDAIELTKKYWVSYFVLVAIAGIVLLPIEGIRIATSLSGIGASEGGAFGALISLAFMFMSGAVQITMIIAILRNALATAEDKIITLEECFEFDARVFFGIFFWYMSVHLPIILRIDIFCDPGVVHIPRMRNVSVRCR